MKEPEPHDSARTGSGASTGGEVSLREVIPTDLPVFFGHQREPDALHMADFASRDEAAFMAHWRTILADASVLARTIVWRDRVAGNIVSYDKDGRRLVGYWVGSRFWGRGIATRALDSFIAVDRQRPLHAFVAERNLGSVRVLEKCGFEPVPSPSPGELLFELRS